LKKEAEVSKLRKTLARYLRKETSMNKFINFSEFMHYLIDEEQKAKKGGEIVKAILEAKPPRLTQPWM